MPMAFRGSAYRNSGMIAPVFIEKIITNKTVRTVAMKDSIRESLSYFGLYSKMLRVRKNIIPESVAFGNDKDQYFYTMNLIIVSVTRLSCGYMAADGIPERQNTLTL